MKLKRNREKNSNNFLKVIIHMMRNFLLIFLLCNVLRVVDINHNTPVKSIAASQFVSAEIQTQVCGDAILNLSV